ncbi:MAG TPA: hypothetical protein VKK79_23740 [Candidatus Lokiarchaeia archaeon]|nr:hypothetical protein [Candidatus Lokiarchaeia archaeon]
MQTIKGGNCNAFIVSPVIAESYFQLCKLGGQQFAETCLNNFQRDIPHTMVTINRAIEYKAGSFPIPIALLLLSLFTKKRYCTPQKKDFQK